MNGTPAGAGPADGPHPADTTPFSPAPARRKRRLRWGVGITLAGFLVGGGIALAVSSGGPGTLAASTVPAASQAQGTMLNSELNTASSTAAAVSLPRVRWALARLRLLGGIHGEFTFRHDGGYRTLAFERGIIQSVNGTDVVVVAKDGTSWTWMIVGDTVVRQDGSKTTTGALSPGETVFAGGPVVNGAKDARLIVIRSGGSGSAGSGTGSSSSVSGPAGTSVG